MKKIFTFLFAGSIIFAMGSCSQDEINEVKSFDKFIVENTEVGDETSKVYLDWQTTLSRLLYENGDKIKVNGVEFTMTESSGIWYANGSSSVTASTFYMAYADATSSNTGIISGSGPEYTFKFTNDINAGNPTGLILAASTTSNVVTLKPACAIIRLNTGGIAMDYVKVGFEGNVIPREGIVDASTGKITSASAYIAGVTAGGGGKFLQMVEGRDGESWYVAVPVVGDASRTTIYFEWKKSSDSAPTQYKTSGQVDLRRGYVYTVGTDRYSPFTANGATTSVFRVGEGSYVRFSCGNLQYKAYESSTMSYNLWRFAEHQYDIIGTNNENISMIYEGWIDLFGWGTSGYGGIMPYQTSELETSYYPGGDAANDLTGTYANNDWGVYHSNGISFGSNTTTGSWRTLTAAEWNYLLNLRNSATSKWALATVNGVRGLVILPESWTLPSGVTFNSGKASGYLTNTYTAEQWDKMEIKGAVFLPGAGFRNGTSTDALGISAEGYYWSTTGDEGDGFDAHCLMFSNAEMNANGYNARPFGCSVRLVKNFGVE